MTHVRDTMTPAAAARLMGVLFRAREIVSKSQRTDATTTAKMSPLPSLALRSGAEINVHFQLGTVVEYRDRLEDTDVLLN